MHLFIKFRQSVVKFFIELNKIDYVKDYCKDIVFDVIKTRANMSYSNSYIVAEQMIVKLHFIFGTYNKIIKSDAKLHDLSFIIKDKDKKKTFEIFYARFSAAITSLNYSDILKIFNLKRLISTRLRYYISNKNFITFAKLIARLRHIAANLKVIDKVNFKKSKIEGDQTSKEFDE